MKGLALDSGEFISADELNAKWLPRKATEEEMRKEQPTALRLADVLIKRQILNIGDGSPLDEAAAELRRLHAENEALRAQIWQGEPSQAASDAYDRIDHFLRQKLDDHDYAHYSFDLDLVWSAAPASQQKPMTDEQDRALCEAHCNAASDEYFKARPQLDSDANRRIFYAGHRKAWIDWQAAHNIGEKK